MSYVFRQNHPNADMAICPFNASHHVPREQERDHLLECRDKRMIEIQKFNEPLPGHHGYLNNPTVYGSSLIKMEEELEESERQLLRLDDTTSTTVSNFERSINNRSRLDVSNRGRLRKASSERHPPVTNRPMTSAAARSSYGLRRSPSPALEGSRPGHVGGRRASPSPRRFGDVSSVNSTKSYGTHGTMYKSYKS